MSRATIIGAIAIFATLATLYVVVPENGNARELSQNEFVNRAILKDLFQQWKLNFGKEYTGEEETLRFSIFVDNYEKILAFNAEDNGAILGLNQFADLTSEEFGATIGCLNENDIDSMKNFPTVELTVDYPNAVDWRNESAVTSVKNQGQCGGCWAFAAAATLESLNFLKGNTLVDLSPQQLIDCVPDCMGCNGCDNLYNSLNYTSYNGIESWSDYPFNGVTQQCRYDKSKVVFTNQGYTNVQPKSVDQLKTAIAQQPTEVGIQANQLIFQLYAGGVISKLCGDRVDHAVTAVGYGPQNGVDAFIIKNSWGETWGLKGYVYISTDATSNSGNGVCGVLSSPAYPTQV